MISQARLQQELASKKKKTKEDLEKLLQSEARRVGFGGTRISHYRNLWCNPNGPP